MSLIAPDLARCTRLCLRRSPIPFLPPSRNFTYTSARRRDAALPTFPPTSSPELSTLLSTIRTNIFLPCALIKPQQDLVFQKSKHHLLTGDVPVVVDIGGESHTLKPLDHLYDEPAKKPSWNRVLALLKEGGTKKDWDVVPPLLEGFQRSKRKVTLGMMQKMISWAGDAGAQNMVKDCARRVQRTGLSLSHANTVRQVMLLATTIAIQSRWSKEGLEKAIKFAEEILELMEDPRNVQDSSTYDRAIDPRQRPEIVGMILSLVATRAVKFAGARDEDGKVQRYMDIMLRLWTSGHDTFKEGLEFQESYWKAANMRLETMAPMWQGLKMEGRMQLQSGRTPESLSSDKGGARGQLLAELEHFITKATTVILSNTNAQGEGKRKGLKMYREMKATLE